MMAALHCLSTVGCEFAKAVINRCAGRIRKCSVSTSQDSCFFFVIYIYYIIIDLRFLPLTQYHLQPRNIIIQYHLFGKHHLMHKLRRTRKIPDMLHSMAVTRQHDRNPILHTILQDLPVISPSYPHDTHTVRVKLH